MLSAWSSRVGSVAAVARNPLSQASVPAALLSAICPEIELTLISSLFVAPSPLFLFAFALVLAGAGAMDDKGSRARLVTDDSDAKQPMWGHIAHIYKQLHRISHLPP